MLPALERLSADLALRYLHNITSYPTVKAARERPRVRGQRGTVSHPMGAAIPACPSACIEGMCGAVLGDRSEPWPGSPERNQNWKREWRDFVGEVSSGNLQKWMIGAGS